MNRHNFKQLTVWQRARRLVIQVYNLSRKFPKDELFGLTSQIRRTAVSIPSNIADGGRGTDRQLIQFCNVAQGSAFELETQVVIDVDLGFLAENDGTQLQKEISEIQRMIDGFINRFK